MNREEAIRIILESTDDQSCFVTTTGKISREAYEQSQKIYGGHERIFMTVGGMGYASMIAAGIAANVPNQRIYCLDGDGALLMHMGNLAFLGQMSLKNMVHILSDLNNFLIFLYKNQDEYLSPCYNYHMDYVYKLE